MAALVKLVHPSGRFTVEVSPQRAETLRGRGFADPEPAKPARKSVTKTAK